MLKPVEECLTRNGRLSYYLRPSPQHLYWSQPEGNTLTSVCGEPSRQMDVISKRTHWESMSLNRMQRSLASFCNGYRNNSEHGLMRKHQVRSIKQSPSPISFENIKVLRTKERWEVFKLKDTEETWLLNVTWSSSLGPFAIKDIIGMTGDTSLRSGG